MKIINQFAFLLLLCIFSSCKKDPDQNPNTVADIDGNKYNLIEINGKKWATQNLRVSRFRNGDLVPLVKSDFEWEKLVSPGCCYLNNLVSNIDRYGYLYNFYAVNDTRNLAPKGYHIATDEDWDGMIESLGGMEKAGGKLKEAGFINWNIPNQGATNESGFTCKGGGYRDRNSLYQGEGIYCAFWTSSQCTFGQAWGYTIFYDKISVNNECSNPGQIGSACYVRFVED